MNVDSAAMKLEINVAEIHLHVHHVVDAPELVDVIVHAATEINQTLKSMAQEIKQMADSLPQLLDQLDQAIAAELQQVVAAINNGADAVTQIETAKTRISQSIANLKSDDAPPPAPAE